MNEAALARLLRGKFSFLKATPENLRSAIPEWEEILPVPQRIFLRREEATPLQGFAILITEPLREMREHLAAYVEAEEEFEVAAARGRGISRSRANAAWKRYEQLLEQVSENAAGSSFGRRYPSIFWLYHSVAVARLFKESPQRIRRADLSVGKARGDQLKYLVFNRYLDRVLALSHDVARRVSDLTEEPERDHFPILLARMRDNVLILTEDHVSPDLRELDSFLNGNLRIDGREFRSLLENLAAWHDERLQDDSFRRAIGRLLDVEEHEPTSRYLSRSGYVSYLATRPDYDPERFPPPEWVKVWENLIAKLKEFELLSALRRLIVPIQQDGARLKCSAAAAGLALTGQREVELSESTRPMDFMTPWVVDPLVQRFGLIYDITEFSAIVSALRRSGVQAQDDSIRQIFRFQRRVNQLARDHRLQLEKYLGDGALYSGRFPTRLAAVAIHLQRYYRRSRDEGFHFDRGLRIALNYGKYRLLPIEAAGGDQRYEFFGHGIVELTRLVTGKTSQEIDDVKTSLLSRGYDRDEVDRFFKPVAQETVELVDRTEEGRPFFAYVNASGVLINEGIVATQLFVEHLAESPAAAQLYRAAERRRRYVALSFDEGSGPITIGIRKLGLAQLKGLGALAIYELIDGESWSTSDLELLDGTNLAAEVEKDFELVTRTGARRP